MAESISRIAAKLSPEAQSLNTMIEDCQHRCETRLKFPPPLETRFMDHVRANNRRQMILAASLAMPFYCSFIVFDIIYRPELIAEMLLLRLIVLTAMTSALIVVLLNKTNTHLPGYLSIFGLIVTSICTGLMLKTPDNPIIQFEPYSFLLLAIIGNIALPMRVPHAFLATTANFLIACYFVLPLGALTPDERAAPLIYLGATTLLTLFANFRLESSQRKVFLSYMREKIYADALTSEYRTLNLISQTDHLTRLANRRQFDAFLAESWLRAGDNSEELALLMIDVDHFKTFNDTYGHLAGDKCLSKIASVVRQCVRSETDLAARFGGEEFAIVMPDSGQDAAISLAARLHNRIAKLAISHSASPTGRVTVSIGIAVAHPDLHHDDVQSLIVKADRALYKAKKHGRDGTVRDESIDIRDRRSAS